MLKIVGGMKGGAFGVMRMWQGFRNKCGGSNTSITFSEFKHGLKMYGLNFEPKLQVEIFHSIDKNDSGGIQIFEFIDTSWVGGLQTSIRCGNSGDTKRRHS